MAVGSAKVVETKVKTKRHWRPRSFALDFAPGESCFGQRVLAAIVGRERISAQRQNLPFRALHNGSFRGDRIVRSSLRDHRAGKDRREILAKPADRRGLIEEAAGISKFRARQRAAESRLDTAKSNLARIFDIISEVETQVSLAAATGVENASV